MDKVLLEKLAVRIKELRKLNKYTQDDLADLAQIARSTLGNINYNWRIALAPEEAIDYLTAHEVSHLKHPNHSREFWECVKYLSPSAEGGRRWLKQNGNLLYSYD